MIRLLFAVVLALALAGCKGSNGKTPIDPFYGQTKIPPPGTGQISRRPANDPYYRNQAATSPQGNPETTTGLAANSHPAASPTLVAQPDAATPPANRSAARRPGDQIEIPLSARRRIPTSGEKTAAGSSSVAANPPSRPAAAASSAAASAASPAAPERIVQTITPRGEDAARQPPAIHSPPSATRATAAAVDIMDLPPVGSGATIRRDDQVQRASAVAAASKPVAATAIGKAQPIARGTRNSPDPLGNFGYSTDYRRLRGRLEYLEKQQLWKLRYIPIDGPTDQYGGSVVFEESDALARFKPGDFVEVRGELAERTQAGKDFAPGYQIAEIRALGA